MKKLISLTLLISAFACAGAQADNTPDIPNNGPLSVIKMKANTQNDSWYGGDNNFMYRFSATPATCLESSWGNAIDINVGEVLNIAFAAGKQVKMNTKADGNACIIRTVEMIG